MRIRWLLVLVLIAGCSTVDDIVCNEPYIRFADTCCLDANENEICDTDETIPAAAPPDPADTIKTRFSNIDSASLEDPLFFHAQQTDASTGYARSYLELRGPHLERVVEIARQVVRDHEQFCTVERPLCKVRPTLATPYKLDLLTAETQIDGERATVHVTERLTTNAVEITATTYYLMLENGTWLVYDWASADGSLLSSAPLEDYARAQDREYADLVARAEQLRAQWDDKCIVETTDTEFNKEQERMCYDAKYVDVAASTKNTDVCNEITTNKPWWIGTCYAAAARAMNAPDTCGTAPADPYEPIGYPGTLTARDVCYYDFFASAERRQTAKFHPEICSRIANEKMRENCINLEWDDDLQRFLLPS